MKRLDQVKEWTREVRRIEDILEATAEEALLVSYRKMLKDIKGRLIKAIDEYSELSFSEKLSADRQASLTSDIEKVIKEQYKMITNTAEGYGKDKAQLGYHSIAYQLEGTTGLEIGLPLLTAHQINATLKGKAKTSSFSELLWGRDRVKLTNIVNGAILNELTKQKGRGSLAKDIAEELAEKLGGDITRNVSAYYKKALRIARTEGGRIQTEANQLAYKEASKAVPGLEKEWMATLDKKTRRSHGRLDGQRVPFDGVFTFDGHETEGPRKFGIASLDINCRCTTVPIVDGIGPDERRDNMAKKDIKYKPYSEWAKDNGVPGFETPKRAPAKKPKRKAPQKAKAESYIQDLGPHINAQTLGMDPAGHLKMLQGAPAPYQKLWENCKDSPHLTANNQSAKKGAFFRPHGGVFMDFKSDTVDRLTERSISKRAYETFFHEYGHALDYAIAEGVGFASSTIKLSNGKTLGGTLLSEGEDFISKAKAYATAEIKEKAGKGDYYHVIYNGLDILGRKGPTNRVTVRNADVYNAIGKRLEDIIRQEGAKTGHAFNFAETGTLTDAWGGPTKGAINNRDFRISGHSKSYWKAGQERTAGTEIFAELYSAYIRGASREIEIFGEFFPETVKAFNELLKVLTK